MRELRHKGIYLLPGEGRPVRAVRSKEDGYNLYDAELGERLPPRFTVDARGAVLDWHGDPAAFTADELIDTGETSESAWIARRA